MLKDFIEKLSSSEPTPGGGSVSALNASLAASLCSMVFNLSIDKKEFQELKIEEKSKIQNALISCNRQKNEFLALMDQDAEGFYKLILSFKLPKNDEKEKEIRKIAIQEGYKAALSVPLDVARRAFELYDIISLACEYGNKNLLSDVEVAAISVNSAIESGVINVKVNLSGITDEAYKNKIAEECAVLLKESAKRKTEIIEKTNKNTQ
jgi:formiminotetrahydrofolate cyclodeaminase